MLSIERTQLLQKASDIVYFLWKFDIFSYLSILIKRSFMSIPESFILRINAETGATICFVL